MEIVGLVHFNYLLSVVCNFVKKHVFALSDTRDSLSHVSEGAENWLASQSPPMTDDQFRMLLNQSQ